MPRKTLAHQYIVTTDHIQQWGMQAVDWVQKRYKLLAVIGGGVILVIGGVVGVQTWRQQRIRQATALLAKATAQIQTASRGKSSTYSEETLTALQTVVDSYPHTSAAIQAHWYLGNLYFERGEYTAAQKAYEKALEGAEDNPKQLIPALVHLNLAYTKEANKDYTGAISAFEAVIISSASWLHGEAYLGIGRCQERAGEFTKAIATYEKAQLSSALDEITRHSLEERLLVLRSSQRTGTPPNSKSPSNP